MPRLRDGELIATHRVVRDRCHEGPQENHFLAAQIRREDFTIATTIIAALFAVVVTILLGILAGWNADFVGDQANVLIRMVLRYTLPLNLFAAIIGMSSVEALSQHRRVFAILLNMIGSYAVTLVIEA